MSLFTTPGLKHNLSLYAVPAGWLISMAPLWYAVGVANSTSKGAYNNAMPKESWDNVASRLPPKIAGRVLRAVAANNNSHINLPLFAAALAAANAAHVNRASLHFWAGGYLTFRLAYNLAYILVEDALFIKAADKYKNIPW